MSRKIRTSNADLPPLPGQPAPVSEVAADAGDSRLTLSLERTISALGEIMTVSDRTTTELNNVKSQVQFLTRACVLSGGLSLGFSLSLLLALSHIMALGAVVLAVALSALLAWIVLEKSGTLSSSTSPMMAARLLIALKKRLEEELKQCQRDAITVDSLSPRVPGGFDLDHTMDEIEDDEGARLAGMSFNTFSGIPQLDFERDVLSQLDEDHQALFRSFDAKFELNLPTLGVLDKSQNPDKFTRLRFLQADQYKVDDAVARLSRTVIWRRNHLDAFILKPNYSLLKRCRGLRPRVWCGYDVKGRPLMFEKLGLFFGSDEAFKGMTLEHWIKGYSYEISELMQMFREYTIRTSKYQHNIAYVGDLAGLRVMSAMRMIPFLKSLVNEVESHFPELAGKVMLINAPSFLPRLFAIVKRFLDPVTAGKISIHNGPARKELIEAYGIDAIPMEYGGLNPILVPAPPHNLTPEFEAQYPPVSGEVP